MRYSLLLVCIVVPMLAACQSVSSRKAYDMYDYSAQGALNLDIARIEFVEEYISPFGPPHVEHKFPIKPAQGIMGLVGDQMHPTGSVGVLRATIIDASVVEDPLPESSIFDLDKSRYTGRLEVLFEIYKPGHMLPRAKFTAFAKRTETITDNISLQSRESFYYDLTKRMLDELRVEIDKSSRKYFTLYVFAASGLYPDPYQ